MNSDSLQGQNNKQFSSIGPERSRAKFLGAALRAAACMLFLLILSSPALATIDTIKGTLTCFVGCNRNVVQLISQGEDFSFEVVGRFVDTSTAVEIQPQAGVQVSYGTRKGGANSSIIVRFDVGPNATPGERTIRMRYAVEVSGPDTFKVRVVPKGTITQIQFQRRLPFRPGGPATELVAPTGMPLNEEVLLIVTGTKLENAQVRSESTYSSVRVLPGATDTRMVVEIEFTSAGQGAGANGGAGGPGVGAAINAGGGHITITVAPDAEIANLDGLERPKPCHERLSRERHAERSGKHLGKEGEYRGLPRRPAIDFGRVRHGAP